MPESLGRFGNHPDAGTDFTIEAEVIEGLAYDVSIGNSARIPFLARLDRALTFQAGNDDIAQKAKLGLYELRDKFTLGREASGEFDELGKVASAAYQACLSAWSNGEGPHHVKRMMDAVDDLGIVLGEVTAGVARYPSERPAFEGANNG